MESPRGQYLDPCRLVYMLLEHTELLCITHPQLQSGYAATQQRRSQPLISVAEGMWQEMYSHDAPSSSM